MTLRSRFTFLRSLVGMLALLMLGALPALAVPGPPKVVIFSLEATAAYTLAGHNAGQSYTFQFTTTPAGTFGSGTSTGGSFFLPDTFNIWSANALTPALFSSIGGNAFLGSYTINSSVANIFTTKSGQLGFGGSTTTLLPPDTTTPIDGVSVSLGGVGFVTQGAFPGAYIDPVSFFSNASGSQTFSDGTISLSVNGGAQSNSFNVTSFSIDLADAPVAVPEPSTYAAMAGAGALGFAWWRRRKARSVAAA